MLLTLCMMISVVLPEQEKPWTKMYQDMPMTFSMRVFPEKIHFGDTIYIQVLVTNHGTEPCTILDGICAGDAAFNMSVPSMRGLFHAAPESLDRSAIQGDGYPTNERVVQPGKSYVLLKYRLAIPSLDELEDPFWKELREKTLTQEVSCTIEYSPLAYGFLIPDIEKIKCKITICPRPQKEFELIQTWYKNTPSKMFPTYDDREKRKFLRKQFLESGKNFIQIGEYRYAPHLFLRRGYRYPGDPNCPETWQGWKELEESLTPSTMRDEIRMTRIVIQYCDTEDSKVLDELTEWLQNMNEIQRVVMVKDVMNLRGKLSQDGEVRKPLLQLIETIKPFSAEELPAEIPAETGK